MHVLIGLLGLVAVLFGTMETSHSRAFTGLVYRPAIVLLVFAPICIAITSFPFDELWASLRSIRRAVFHRAAQSRASLFDDLTRFATEVRQRRPAAALSIAEASSHPLFRQLAPLVVKQYPAASIEHTASTAIFCQTSALRRSEEVLNTLGRVAPAAGLIGTVLGLISLLKELAKFEKLGPSMALALLCTLYGLLLANGVYQPLARAIHRYATVQVEESKLLTRALILIGEGRPVADVRQLFELSTTEPIAQAEVVELDRSANG